MKRGTMAACALILIAQGLGWSARGNEQDVSGFSLRGIARVEGIFYASIVNDQTGQHFLLSSRSPEQGLELLAITPSEEAIIRQAGRSFSLRLGWSGSAAAVATDFSPAKPAAVPVAAVENSGAPTPPRGGRLPLVFQSADLKGLKLTDEQQAVIARLKQEFVAAVGGKSPTGETTASTDDSTAPVPSATDDPADAPVSGSAQKRRLWDSAQEQSDDELKMLFGTEAFNLYQMGLAPKPQ